MMDETTRLRVILIDDQSMTHRLVMMVLENAPDIVLVGQGTTGIEALALYQHYHPDVVLMDVMMPGKDGISATHDILSYDPKARILVLSGFQDDDSVSAMLEAGACGYILKVSLTQDLVNGIRAAASGSAVLSMGVLRTLRAAPAVPTPNARYHLTERELEVLRLMAAGMGNKQVADELVISISTVKFHLNNILEKMGVETRAEAIVLATRDNLV
jgi:NarL family two-component system response regulator LiaR